MINYLIISKKKWDIENFEILNKSHKFSYKLDKRKIIKYSPKIIFFIHWSEKIPLEIFKRYLCIQFHSSDLPKFKGGSPIQNQIVNGIKKTKITAFKVSDKIDAGDICLKNNLDLNGTATQIYQKMTLPFSRQSHRWELDLLLWSQSKLVSLPPQRLLLSLLLAPGREHRPLRQLHA